MPIETINFSYRYSKQIIILVCVSSCFAYMLLSSIEKQAPTFYLGGIEINEPNQMQWSNALQKVGFNTRELTVYAHQGKWNSSDLQYSDNIEEIGIKVRSARYHNLKTALILRVSLDHSIAENEFLWHGLVMPTTDEELISWFEKYKHFVTIWAKHAESLGVDILAIGSEMNLISATRPISTLPSRSSFYLNKKAHEKFTDQILTLYQENYPKGPKTINTHNSKTEKSLKNFIIKKRNALTRWAKQVTFHPNKIEKRIEKINTRRKLLQSCWRDLIATIRKVYSGTLTYAANFDNYEEVGFWSDLDMVGINAYFPLRNTLLQEESTHNLYPLFVTEWTKILRGINTFRHNHNITEKKVLFTELGYTFKQYSTIKPWALDGFFIIPKDDDSLHLLFWDTLKNNYNERIMAIKALKTASDIVENESQEVLLQGILYWKLSQNPEHLSIEPFTYLLQDEKLTRELLQFLN